MGAAASAVKSFCKLPEQINLAVCKEFLGECFDQEIFDEHSSNGMVTKSKLIEIYYTNQPSHVLLSCTSESESNTINVNFLREELMKLGYEVYTPELGSSIVPKHDGKNMNTIMASVEKASIVVMCVSPFFGEDITCFAQANYARVYGSKTAYVQMTSKTPVSQSWVEARMEEEKCTVPFPAYDRSSALKAAKSLSNQVGNASKKVVPKKVVTVMANGDEFTGTLDEEGRKHGQGKCVYANPLGRIYEGDFFNDKRHGFGMCIYPNGDVFTGDFVDEKYKGKGVYKYAEGDIFWGAYDHGQRNGYGECKYSSGDFYQGDFKDDMYHGKGKYMWEDGAFYEGVYFEDQMHGQGTMTNPDGSISFTGRWEMGEEVM